MNATLCGYRMRFWCAKENSMCQPPGWKNHNNQLKDGCEDNICDPRSCLVNHLWDLISWVELHPSLVKKVGNSVNHLRSEDPWRFKDEYKHKPP
ncbi:hypothetical protein AHAS_Ahas15G0217700 [Arachis hypogaea]